MKMQRHDRSHYFKCVSYVLAKEPIEGELRPVSGKSYHKQSSLRGNFAQTHILMLQYSPALSSRSETYVKAG